MKNKIRNYFCLVMAFILTFQSVIPVAASELDILDNSIDEISEGDVLIEDNLAFDTSLEDEEQTESASNVLADTNSTDISDFEAVLTPLDNVIDEANENDLYANDFPDSDDLFAKYVDSMFGVNYFEDTSEFGPDKGGLAYLHLNENEMKFYDKAVDLIEAVANGEESNTKLILSPEDIGLAGQSAIEVEDLFSCTYDSSSGQWKAEINIEKQNQAINSLKSQLDIDQKKILRAVASDYPEWLYWFGRSYGIGPNKTSVRTSTGIIKNVSGTTGTADGVVEYPAYKIYFSVAKSYAVRNSDSTYDIEKADVTKTRATKTAVANAKAIATSCSGLGDYSKLLAFKERICSMVTYNHEAVGNFDAMGSDPWELIYVFDGDSTTNVVCEGYSKAFQYLCDLSMFDNDVDVISVTGDMDGEGHEWNIVRFNDANFLVDVTNCDNISGITNGHTGLFMKGYKSGSVSLGYVIHRAQVKVGSITYDEKDINYEYYDDTKNLYADELGVLALSHTDFDPNSQPDPLPLPEITKQPADLTVYYGDSATFTVTASGDDLKYKWQYSTDGKTWSDVDSSLYQNATLSFKAAKTQNGYFYRCIVSNKDNKSVTSDLAKLLVVEPLVITKQPADAIVYEGEDATFTVEASGEGLTYLWLYSTDDWKSCTDVLGAESATLTIRTSEYNNKISYKCMIHDVTNNYVTSEPVKVIVRKHIKITKQPSDQTQDRDKVAYFEIKAEGGSGALKYQWYYSSDNGKNWTKATWGGNATNKVGATAFANREGWLVRCVITDEAGTSETSESAKLHVNIPITITKQPSDQTQDKDKVAYFEVKAEGGKGTLKYQWYYSADVGKTWTKATWGGSTTNKVGATAFASREGWLVRCVITDGSGNSVTSGSAKLHVNIPITITKQPSDQTQDKDKVAYFEIKAEGGSGALKYQWYYSSDNGKNWTKATWGGNATNKVGATAFANREGWLVRCVITDEAGTSVTSESAKLHVNTPITITKQPSDQTQEKDKVAYFEVKAEGGNGTLKYQWYYSSDGGKNWTKATWGGNATNKVGATAFVNREGWLVRCVITDEAGTSVTSGSAKLHVNIPITITKQPSDQTQDKDKVAYFEVKAEGGKGTLKYQWYYSSDGGKTWTKSNWGGSTTNRVGATAFASREGWLVRCVITDEAGNSVISGSAKLHVNIPITITKQPSDQTQDKDKVAYFEVKAEGGKGTLKYQWYYSSDGGKTWTKSNWGGSTTNRVGATAFASREGWLVRCVITDGSGNSVTSGSAKLHVNIPITITKQPSDQTQDKDKVAYFEVKAEGGKGTLKYQWYYSSDGGKTWTKSNWGGSTTNKVGATAFKERNGWLLKCVITDDLSQSVTSSIVKLTVRNSNGVVTNGALSFVF